jgi:hypothetical protein
LQGWKNSWFLARFDIMRHGLGYLLSVLFFGYASGMVALMLNETRNTDNSSFAGSYMIIDFYFVCIMGMSGFAFASRYYRGYWRNKSFSKKAVFLKSFPISARDTIGSKILLVAFHSLSQGGLFFAVIYFVPSPMHQMLNLPQYIEFIWMWFGYAFVLGSVYAYMEISLSEKAYLLASIIIALFFALITFLGWLLKYHIVEHTMGWIRDYGIWFTLISLGISMIGFYILRIQGIKKIHTRDLRL